MPDPCEVVRRDSVADGMGGTVEGEPYVAETTKCRLEALTGREAVAANQLRAEIAASVSVPLGADVRASDTLRIAGRKYEVEAVLPKSEAFAADVKVLVSGG